MTCRVWAVLALLFGVCVSSAQAQTYSYDERGRLIRAVYEDCSVIRYFYDAAGNRTERFMLAGDGSCAGNQPPNGVNDAITLAPGEVRLVGLLANDTDPNTDALRLVSVTQGDVPLTPGGEPGVQLQSDRQTVQITAPSTEGSYAFSYTVEDAFGLTDEAQVSVSVENSNSQGGGGGGGDGGGDVIIGDFAVDDTGFMVEGQTIAYDVLANDQGDGLTLVSVERTVGNSTATVLNNRVSIAATGAYPSTGAYPAERYTYTAENGAGEQSTAELVVTVNRKPVLTNRPSAIEMYPGQELDLVMAYFGASDPDGDPLNFESVFVNLLAMDRAEPSADGQTLHLRAPNATGLAILSCRIGDGRFGWSNCGFNINVIEQSNTCPVARNDSLSVDSEASGEAIYVLANDSDADNDGLSVTEHGQPSNGGSVSRSGSVLYFNAPMGPASSSFSYTISDGQCTDTATVSVSVSAPPPPPNRNPVVVEDSATVSPGQTVTLYPLSNDSDPDGDAIYIDRVESFSGGSGSVINGGSAVQYTAPSSPGSYRFAYVVEDGRGGFAWAWFNITVSQPNRNPVAVADSFVVTAGQPTILSGILDNDSDPDGDPLTIERVYAFEGGGSGSVMPTGRDVLYNAPPLPGNARFGYVAIDGRGGYRFQWVNITVISSGGGCTNPADCL